MADQPPYGCSAAGAADQGRFCLSANLEHYFGLHEQPLAEWQALLAMELLGFGYFGIDDLSRGQLNGISGPSRELLDNLCRRLELRRRPLPTEQLRQPDGPLLVMVDDFHLRHSEVYQRQHNQRFIVAHAEGGRLRFFDLGQLELDLAELWPAVIEVFCLEWSEGALDPAGLQRRLRADLLGTTAQRWCAGLDGMRRFHEDLQSRGAELDPELCDGLFFSIKRPSGPGTTRWQTATALQQISTADDVADVAPMVQGLLELADQWRIVGNLLFKLARVPRPATARSLAHRVGRIITSEAALAGQYAGRRC